MLATRCRQLPRTRWTTSVAHSDAEALVTVGLGDELRHVVESVGTPNVFGGRTMGIDSRRTRFDDKRFSPRQQGDINR